MDFPGIAEVNASKVSVELFSVTSTGAGFVFHICDSKILSIGSQLSLINTTITTESEPQIKYDSSIEPKINKVVFDMGLVHTSSMESSVEDNKMLFSFDAFAPKDPTIVGGSIYHVIAGASYDNGNYIWICNSDLTAQVDAVSYPAQGTIKSVPALLKKGESGAIQITLHITHPSPQFTMQIFNPYGYDDRVSIGKPTFKLGSSFSCNKEKFWKITNFPNSMGTGIGKVKALFAMLINSDYTRTLQSDANKIEIIIPVTAMSGYEAKGDQDIAIGIKLDDTDIWSTVATIKIEDAIATITSSPPSSVTGVLLNTEKVYPGSPAIFQLKITIPPNGVSDLNQIILDGNGDANIIAGSVMLVDSGACGMSGIVKPYSNLGICKNVDVENSTNVLVNIAFETDPKIGLGVTKSVKATVAGFQVTGLDFTTVASFAPKSITANGTSLGFESLSVYPGTEIGLNAMVTVPAGAVLPPLTIVASPDIKLNSKEMRICQFKIHSVGLGVACLKMVSTQTNRSLEDLYFDDKASFNVNNECPGTWTPSQPYLNSFSVDLIYSLPVQPNLVDGAITPGLGIFIDNVTLFSSISSKTLSTAVLPGIQNGSTILTDTTAFLAVYSSNTSKSYNIGGIQSTRFVFKPKPKTRARYTFSILPLGAHRVCKIKITRIGENIPCARKPEGYVDEFNEMRIDYAGHKDGTAATLTLGVITNWGNNKIEADLYADENAIEVSVFTKHNPDIAAGTSLDLVGTLAWTGTNAGSVIATNKFNPSPTNAPPEVNNLALNPVFAIVLQDDDLGKVFKGVPKILSFKLTVPETFKGPVKIVFENPNYASNSFYHFCDVKITKVGLNIPCVDQNTKSNTSSTYTEVDGAPEFYDSVYIQFDLHHQLTFNNPAENEVHVELTIKVPLDYAGSAAKVIARIIETVEHEELELLVENVPANYGDIPGTEFMVTAEESTPFITHTHGSVWVPFNITIPRNSRIPLILAAKTPSQDGRAVLTVEDIRFKYDDSNICCTSSMINIKVTNGVTLSATNNVTTFMQKDYLKVDMGYVVNGHYSLRKEFELKKDSTFVVEVLVQVTDHPLTVHNSLHSVSLAAESNGMIVVASSNVQINRTTTALRPTTERAGISLSMEIQNQQIAYSKGEKVVITGIIKHSAYSRAEAHGLTKVRLITPVWLGYILSSDSCTTNYTVDNKCSIDQPNGDGNTSVNFLFYNGIYYTDIISINFTLTVDPLNKLLPGRGSLNSSILSYVHCTQSQFLGFPTTNSTFVTCGPYVNKMVGITSPPCTDAIQLDNCSITASSALNNNHLPSNVKADDSSVWSPAIRSGKMWKNFIIFDFRNTATLHSVELKFPPAGYRAPSKISIMTSISGLSWHTLKENIAVPMGGIINFTPEVKTRMTKIVIEDTIGSQEKVGIAFVSWKGCPLDLSTQSSCRPDTTRISTDPTKYRHFAVDPLNLILYYCDVNPYRSGIFCFSNQQGTKTFTELPTYVGYIQGFSAAKGRMYFKEILY